MVLRVICSLNFWRRSGASLESRTSSAPHRSAVWDVCLCVCVCSWLWNQLRNSLGIDKPSSSRMKPIQLYHKWLSCRNWLIFQYWAEVGFSVSCLSLNSVWSHPSISTSHLYLCKRHSILSFAHHLLASKSISNFSSLICPLSLRML